MLRNMHEYWLPPRDSNPDMLIQRQETDDSAEFLRLY